MTEIRDYSDNLGWQIASQIMDTVGRIQRLCWLGADIDIEEIGSLLHVVKLLSDQGQVEIERDYTELERLRLQVATNQGKVSQEG